MPLLQYFFHMHTPPPKSPNQPKTIMRKPIVGLNPGGGGSGAVVGAGVGSVVAACSDLSPLPPFAKVGMISGTEAVWTPLTISVSSSPVFVGFIDRPAL